MLTDLTTKWAYTGDADVSYGGAWLDMSTFDEGYVTCIRVIDLDSGCGFTGAVLIEHLVILTDKANWAESVACCGWDIETILAYPPELRKQVIAEACLSYGHYDPDDGWDNYASPTSEVVQTQTDGPMEYDGWKAAKRVFEENLEGYIYAVHLD